MHAELQPLPPNDRELSMELGVAVADAVAAILVAMSEHYAGDGLTSQTRAKGGEMVARLFHLRQATNGSFDFNSTAHREGKAVLRERLAGCPVKLSDDQLDLLVDQSLGMVAAIAAAKLH